MKASRAPRTAVHPACLPSRQRNSHEIADGSRRGLCRAAEADKAEQAQAAPEPEPEQPLVDAGVASTSTSDPRDDDVLPESLMDSLNQAALATNAAFGKGCRRANVEILLPELWDSISGAVFAEQGDQQRWWKLCKRFAEDLIEQSGAKSAKMLFPDIGVAAYLQNQWKDTPFMMKSLRDKEPVDGTEDLVIVASPDPTNAQDCVKLNKLVPEGTRLALFNPRLVSGDVGIGLNVRRMRQDFLGQFTITYSIWPIGEEGTIFKKFPDKWKVFLLDEKEPGRYKLIAERPERPAGDALDRILMQADREQAEGEGGDGQQSGGILQSVASTVTSMQRFMKSLTN